MDHIIVPIDQSHLDAHSQLVRDIADAAGVAELLEMPFPHITLVAYAELDIETARAVTAQVVAETTPFTVHAHGYGFFTGAELSALSLHVQVARAPPLEALHGRLFAALRGAGADIAGWSAPSMWSPHITLLDRCLDPERLGRATAWLARRHHPSWQIPVDRVALVGGWPERARRREVIGFGG